MIDVRAIERGDVERVLEMWEALLHNGHASDARFCPAARPREVFRPIARDQWTLRAPFPHGLVARVDGAPAGFLAGFPVRLVPVIEQPPTARISDLWVEPGFRRLGVGRALVDAFVAGARAGDHAAIEVGTLSRDDRAVRFWRALGFGDWQVTLRR